ncbi:MAG: hypothetical protein EKE20_16275, partial [Candidatus Symbiopectobacterium sp. Dall1.0]|nr:hypothetical protein [Candidatus Symbiopectobacterium sp. Dall1.0]
QYSTLFAGQNSTLIDKQRNTLAVEEHLALLSAMLCRNDLLAMRELRRHLDTAKQSMIDSMERQMPANAAS